MKKKSIGFIDYFIDEWHANRFPQRIRDHALSGEFELTHAFAAIDPPGKKPLSQWCRDLGVTQAASIEALVEACDCIFVLSPDNPEQHQALSNHALQSGKPVYIDKPFAPDLATARAMFALADAHGSPVFSSSGLRFTSQLQSLRTGPLVDDPARFIATTGGGSSFDIYLIHQIEIIIALMGTGVAKIMYHGNAAANGLNLMFADDRRATVRQAGPLSFAATVHTQSGQLHGLDQFGDYEQGVIDAVLTFYKTGESPVPREQTLQVAAICQTALDSVKQPGVWLDVPVV